MYEVEISWHAPKIFQANSQSHQLIYNMIGLYRLTPLCSEKTKFCHMYQLPDAAAKSLQSHPTLCDPIDGSPPGSSVHRILQARTLEWVAISRILQARTLEWVAISFSQDCHNKLSHTWQFGDKINLFSQSSGGQTSRVRVPAMPHSLGEILL